MSNIVHDYIDDYIERTHKKNESFFEELRAMAEENHIYILKSQVERFLRTILPIIRPKRILEVGTAIGYSALLMADCLPDAHIITIERDADVLELAKENVKKRGEEDRIRFIFGDATDVLEDLSGKFDFVFLDASKGHYRTHFDLAVSKMKPGGVIVTDDVLYMGMTASEKLEVKKHDTITRRLREFLDYICKDTRFETSILPIGDGVALTFIKD